PYVLCNLIDEYYDDNSFYPYHTFDMIGISGKVIIDGLHVINCDKEYIKIYNFYSGILLYKIKLQYEKVHRLCPSYCYKCNDNNFLIIPGYYYDNNNIISYHSVSIENILQNKIIKQNETIFRLDDFQKLNPYGQIFEIKNDKMYLIFFNDSSLNNYYSLYKL